MLVLVFLNRQVNVPMNEHKKAKIIGDHVSFFTFQQFRFTAILALTGEETDSPKASFAENTP